ncbi:hypothetical protein SASPL_100310 [Salvia splendens]|uniref:xyloglucan 6-xylosyltransferase n=1 Tax=Salvia splendens TaxID=180675 RepID=A0A8X8YSG8_SALSN|nr:hypothetical protein SASPL_100310 [Salvia splendens]
MLDRVLSPLNARRLHRAFRKAKLTVLCLFLTLIVLRANIGAGKFGTPEKDLDDIRETFSHIRKRAEPRRVLEEVAELKSTGNADAGSKNYADFDIKKILKDEDDGFPEFKRDPSQPYSLGQKISDWDEQRSEWLKNNPDYPNFVAENKPRVLLVTGSSPTPCENPVGDHYLLKSIKNKIDYTRVHGIEIFYNMALLDAEMAGFWAKLPLIRKLLLSHPEVEFLWWMDSDAMFTDMAYEVPWERYKDHNFVMHGWDEMIYDEKNWIGLNTGSFLLRNCQWSLDILDTWAPMGPKGKVREDAGKILTRELKGRPVFEADDQSAMVYILATEKEKWGEKVYLENHYYLHGYWGILVDKYEQMIESYHPGFGDHRWPLVTHFVGCKPCGKFGDYPVERCLKQMDRAFNFGDNQILQMYGFTHKSLASRKVVRIRNETSKPLEVRDELGLLHPSFKAVKTVFGSLQLASGVILHTAGLEVSTRAFIDLLKLILGLPYASSQLNEYIQHCKTCTMRRTGLDSQGASEHDLDDETTIQKKHLYNLGLDKSLRQISVTSSCFSFNGGYSGGVCLNIARWVIFMKQKVQIAQLVAFHGLQMFLIVMIRAYSDHISILVVYCTPPKCLIQKVHRQLSNLNPKAYEPDVIAIGPYHHDKEHLEAMEHHKLRHMHLLLHENNPRDNVQMYATAIATAEAEARRCYNDMPDTLTRSQFV